MTTSNDLLDHFLSQEVTEYVRDLLLASAQEHRTGVHYFTFNVFNVGLDFDAGQATIEDELDPDSSQTLGLDHFLSVLRQAETTRSS